MTDFELETPEAVMGALAALAPALAEDGEGAREPGLLPRLKAIEAGVRRHALVSPNEDFEEMDLETTPVLHLPFYLATAYQNLATGERRENLKAAEAYFLTFLELMEHYGLLPKELGRIREAYQTNGKYAMERDEKVRLYKEEKVLKDQVEAAASKQAWKEVQRLKLTLSCHRAIAALLYLPQELELLAYRQKLETDPEARKEYERSKNKPVEPMKFWKIDESGQTPVQTVKGAVASQGLVQGGALKGVTGFAHDGSLGIPTVQTTNVNTVMEQKQLVLDRLNQPGWSQPTRTLDEHDQMEYDLMMKRQQRELKAKAKRDEEKKKFGIEDSSDSENEIVSDAKTYKARAWDDWKDDNEKGSGNRNGR